MFYAIKAVTYTFCLSIFTFFVICIMLGMEKIDMSDIAISTLGGVTIALINLMKVLIKQLSHVTPRNN